ncbi:murein hydrolase activator EnvC family protein [Flavobacterium cerinum]|uniref:Peptidase M23 n=1 Tax=Flavobacterium cerinum TaxID=2502784 RepID=A0A3S3Q8N5_9FLAO|nr:peptidoglycan DD-metalloendopeptidase family protein [Flavobacterium cerinum]RWX00025.1 peptidase M23 [Flavobacterium cerinum]
MAKFFLTILLIGFTTLGWSQSDQQKKLELRKAQILKEMMELQNLVSKENKKEKSVLSKIYENNSKIKLSEKLINTTSKQTRLLTDDIYTNHLKINKLNSELGVLKEDYTNMVVRAYKSRSEQSRIMFILSSETFLQAYKRMQYMKQYASFRKVQGEEIKTKMAELENLNVTLDGQKKQKQKLLTESEKQKQLLEKDKEDQEQLVKSIQKDKKKYTADIKKKQQEAREIQRQIDRMVRDAIAAANKKSAKSGSEKSESATTGPNKIVLTKEGKLIADNFKANKGKLPWPVEKGYVSLGYGDQPHPVLKTIEIHNSGVEITTESGSSARAVFGGEVMSVQIISGNKVVYIQHGDFITVYYNLASVNVKSGDKVGTKEKIGTVYTNPGSGKTVLKFFVLQNTTYLNPSSWIAPL